MREEKAEKKKKIGKTQENRRACSDFHRQQWRMFRFSSDFHTQAKKSWLGWRPLKRMSSLNVFSSLSGDWIKAFPPPFVVQCASPSPVPSKIKLCEEAILLMAGIWLHRRSFGPKREIVAERRGHKEKRGEKFQQKSRTFFIIHRKPIFFPISLHAGFYFFLHWLDVYVHIRQSVFLFLPLSQSRDAWKTNKEVWLAHRMWQHL